jgi:hypothetical protein
MFDEEGAINYGGTGCHFVTASLSDGSGMIIIVNVLPRSVLIAPSNVPKLFMHVRVSRERGKEFFDACLITRVIKIQFSSGAFPFQSKCVASLDFSRRILEIKAGMQPCGTARKLKLEPFLRVTLESCKRTEVKELAL